MDRYKWKERIELLVLSESDKLMDRLKGKIKIGGDNECWEWIGAKRGDGYGVMRVHGVLMKSHRLAYILFRGERAGKRVVDHVCFNKGCCNPGHLEAITQGENVRRYWECRNPDEVCGKCGAPRKVGESCKACHLEYMRQYRAGNREKVRRISRQSYHRCKERAG